MKQSFTKLILELLHINLFTSKNDQIQL